MNSSKKGGVEDLRSLTEKHLMILTEANVTTLESLVSFNVIELKNLLDTTLNRASMIIKEARDHLPPFFLKTGKMILEENKNKEYLSTNCSSMDELLGGGGLESSQLTEVYAAFGTGKSQFVFSCIVSALLPSKKYPEGGSAILIDTENTFAPERILQILRYYCNTTYPDLSPETLLENLYVVRPETSVHQKLIMDHFSEDECSAYIKYTGSTKPLRLLVVDSLTALFRAEFIGRGTLNQRQQKLNEHIRQLTVFSNKVGIPVLVTNQIISSPDIFVTEDLAVGGNVVAHAAGTRIRLTKRKRGNIAKIIDSSKLPCNEIFFKIGKRGIVNLEDEDLDLEPYCEQYRKSNIKEEK